MNDVETLCGYCFQQPASHWVRINNDRMAYCTDCWQKRQAYYKVLIARQLGTDTPPATPISDWFVPEWAQPHARTVERWVRRHKISANVVAVVVGSLMALLGELLINWK